MSFIDYCVESNWPAGLAYFSVCAIQALLSSRVLRARLACPSRAFSLDQEATHIKSSVSIIQNFLCSHAMVTFSFVLVTLSKFISCARAPHAFFLDQEAIHIKSTV